MHLLNNKIRRDVAIGLAKKAVAKHGEALTNQFTELNKTFWSQHKMNVQHILDLHSSKWSEPMAVGICTSTTQVEASYKFVDIGGVKRIGQIESYDVKEGEVSALSNLFDMPEFNKIQQFIYRGYSRNELMRLRFTTDTPVPRINNMGDLEKESAFATKCFDAITNLKTICKAFIDTYNQIYNVLQATKTDKQLLELLPEAKEFLPPPAPKERKELVPAEYVNKLRERIAAGVPDQLGGA